MIEMTVFLPLYILILVGIVDYGFFVQQKIQVQEAAAAGAAYATIPGKYKDINGMIAAAQASSSTLGPSITVNAVNVYSCAPGGGAVTAGASCSGAAPLMFAQVTTSYTASPVLRYPWVPSTIVMQGFAAYEVPWAP